jgi:bifunctional non-homologous end joining protein LigD
VVWVEPELVADVGYRGWTADEQLRHASFKGLREDKDPRSVVREG